MRHHVRLISRGPAKGLSDASTIRPVPTVPGCLGEFAATGACTHMRHQHPAEIGVARVTRECPPRRRVVGERSRRNPRLLAHRLGRTPSAPTIRRTISRDRCDDRSATRPASRPKQTFTLPRSGLHAVPQRTALPGVTRVHAVVPAPCRTDRKTRRRSPLSGSPELVGRELIETHHGRHCHGMHGASATELSNGYGYGPAHARILRYGPPLRALVATTGRRFGRGERIRSSSDTNPSSRADLLDVSLATTLPKGD
jgi:hypothetical protein